MMLDGRRVCDRCRSEVDGVEIRVVKSVTARAANTDSVLFVREWVLCPECSRQLNAFMHGVGWRR